MWLRIRLNLIKPFLLLIILSNLLLFFILKPMKVNGNSMNPNLKNNQIILSNKFGNIKRFSIISFKANKVDPGAPKNSIYIKRIIGMPGDYISYKNNGELYINNKKVNQSFINHNNKKNGTLNPEISNIHFNGFNIQTIYDLNNLDGASNRVPKNHYFVMGDNRSVSYDSRFFGCISKDDIIGTVIHIN